MDFLKSMRRFLALSLVSLISCLGIVKADTINPTLSTDAMAQVMAFFKTDEGKAMIKQAVQDPAAFKMPVDQVNMLVTMQLLEALKKMSGNDKKKAKAFFDKTFQEHVSDSYTFGFEMTAKATKALAAYLLGLIGTSASVAGGIGIFAFAAPYILPYLTHNAASGLMQAIWAIPGGLLTGLKYGYCDNFGWGCAA